jgi:hypothetical protein
MYKNTTAEKLPDTTGNLTDFQLNLLKRINNIALSLMPEFEDKSQAMEAITLDDGSLMQLLYSVQMQQKTRASEYEMRKVHRRRENLEAFTEAFRKWAAPLKSMMWLTYWGLPDRQ